MKKILWLGITFSLLFVGHSFAATKTYNNRYSVVITSTSPTSADATVVLTGKSYGNVDICVLSGTDNDACASPSGLGYTVNDANIFYKHIDAIGDMDQKVSISLKNLDPTQPYYISISNNTDKKYYVSSYFYPFSTAIPDHFNYSFKAVNSGQTINATLGGALGNRDSFQLLIQTTPFPDQVPTHASNLFNQNDPAIQKPDAKGVINWSIPEAYGTTYYVRVVEIPQNSLPPTYATDAVSVNTAVSLPFLPIATSKSGDDIIVSGKIDITKIPDFKGSNFVATLQYTSTTPLATATTLSNGLGPLTSHVTNDNASALGINDDGTYYWHLTHLSPSTVYYIQQTVASVDKKISATDVIAQFNSSSGNVILPGSAAQQADLNTRSYTLLSKGFPGLTVLPDPDLCAQEKAAGNAPQVCDLNDLLNYALKLMIGISGVVLVLRLMFEGYQIMVSDVPFLKAKAKGGFLTALGGLVLALSSYIILNTINPKLVSEDVNVAQLSIVSDGDTNTPTVFVNTGQMPGGVICPGSGRSSVIAQIAQSYKGKVTYSQTNKTAAAGPDGNAVLDCSSYVNTVLKCAGYVPGKDFINEGTMSIFANTEKVVMSSGFKVIGNNNVSINGKNLNPGDVVGWPPSSGQGHAIIYIGNGTFMDSHGGSSGRQPGNAIGIYNASQIQSMYSGNINSVERIPM